MNLIIVESPTKAKTLGKFLGDEYSVIASFGHIRDLPEKKLGIKMANGKYTPEYVQTKRQKDSTDVINKLAKKASQIYLATDPDREGEAIAWHVSQVLASSNEPKRVTFHEITKTAIQHALEEPRQLDMNLINAQQARRVLDRLVGYKLSPILWKKVRRGLSAGRVQSVAVRLIAEREREIEAFKPVEYWNIAVKLANANHQAFETVLKKKNDQEVVVSNSEQAQEVESELRAATYQVLSVDAKDFKRTPPAPFTTSTLQQQAANKLGWSAKKTMQVAQGLYEEGYITYHRTDSTNMAAEAVTAAAEYIAKTFGADYALATPRLYKTKSKVAQEAHEAIRPTDVAVHGSNIELFDNRDQARLYEFIWKRFMACQMAEVRGVTVTVIVTGKKDNTYLLTTKGETINFNGWYVLYEKHTEEEDIEGELRLPELTKDELLNFLDLTSEQKFTQPPARYNDASLIKALEEMGIGRPSTYAPTISTIQDRQYVEKEEKRFKPTVLGFAVNDFLMANFADVIDYGFTAKMEDNLDDVANGDKKWEPTVDEFYQPFSEKLDAVKDTAERVKIETEETGNVCPKCGQGQEIVRVGKFGKFLACSRFPECDYKANYQNKTGQKCPKCSDGDVIQRKTRSGRTFFGCSNYPKCEFASWNKPKPDEVKSKDEN
jgi:DNA topoisomerase I